MVDPTYSDASLYSHAYCTAITLMSSPLFFCETHLYSPSARQEIKSVLDVYKTVRNDIFSGIVFPIGQQPDGTQWTGFECQTQHDTHYLTVFREAYNAQTNYCLTLNHLRGKTLSIKNLMTEETWRTDINEKGELKLQIHQPADFLFLSYTIRS